MPKRCLAALTAALLLLSGCSSMLDREYTDIAPHDTAPTTEGNTSTLRAESYQELVNALIYLVSRHDETGSIRLYFDSENVDTELENACLEVVQESPIGAYAVEYIKPSVSFVVSYYQADLQIQYRRTREQLASVVSATGTAAIRSELEGALDAFAPECVLRISYFAEDEAYIRALFQEAYYASPDAALDMPDLSIAIYPDSGLQRIVEILLTYHLEPGELARRHSLLAQACQSLLQTIFLQPAGQRLSAAARAVLEAGGYDPVGGSTAYHALLEGGADSEGLALAMALVCQELGTDFQVVRGTLGEQPHFWLILSTQEGMRHLDLSQWDGTGDPFHTDEEMEGLGYLWDRE